MVAAVAKISLIELCNSNRFSSTAMPMGDGRDRSPERRDDGCMENSVRFERLERCSKPPIFAIEKAMIVSRFFEKAYDLIEEI